MRRAAVGSIVVHGAVAGVLLLIRSAPDPAMPPAPPRVELVEVTFDRPLSLGTGQAPGGGTPTTTKTEAPRANATRDVRVPQRSHPAGDHAMRVADLIGSQTVEQRGDGGMGRGRGGGIGDEEGADNGVSCDATCLGAPAPPPPPPPPVVATASSKARAAKLVFPIRQRDVADNELFVAAVTVDEDGYVVGARLVRGLGGPADRRAEQAIWRFRYEPARDIDGRAIRTQFEQPFLLQ